MRVRSLLAGVALSVCAALGFAQSQVSTMLPVGLKLDEHMDSGTSSNVNKVLDPMEVVLVEPAWQNSGASPLAVTGTIITFTGPSGATYSYEYVDGTNLRSDYGTVAAGATANCYNATASHNCYRIGVQPLGARPIQHWDGNFTETLSSGESKTWVVHIGDSFDDVLQTSGFYRFIETLLHKGITGGCGGTLFCPGDPVTRGQMAVFLLVGEHGSGYAPPACSTPAFNDVPCTSGLAPWINQLVTEGITAGCGNGNYCPGNPVTRAQMSVFLLIAKHGSGYVPPPATGTVFGDVPASNPFAKWIEELSAEGITGGCGGGNFCPSVTSTRGQMAVFLTTTFSLSLYGP